MAEVMAIADARISEDEQRLRGESDHEPEEDTEQFLLALDETIAVLDADGVPYMLMGGIASTCMGRTRWTHDIDLFVRPDDASRVLEALGQVLELRPVAAGRVEAEVDISHGGDVIFRSSGDIVVDDEMLARAPTFDFMGRQVRTVPPEDLLVIKAVVHAEHMPRHWHDALGLLATVCDLDWDYLIRRSRRGARRVLSLLLYAQSDDLVVPWWVIQRLYALLDEGH
jgi:predicted nucleotidyltransferase